MKTSCPCRLCKRYVADYVKDILIEMVFLNKIL